MARSYRREWLSGDLVAGIVLVAMLVPQGIAYSELAGLPPVHGLYATMIPLIVYAILGPSRILVLGPDSAVAPGPMLRSGSRLPARWRSWLASTV